VEETILMRSSPASIATPIVLQMETENASIPLMNQREREKRLERKIEVTGTGTGTGTIAQGMIEIEIETEVTETGEAIEATIMRGGAGILIMVEIGGTNPIQTLLEDSVIALDHSPHQNHNHLNGEANGRVGLIWHLQVQLSSLVQ
jgi:hypothetical protein